MDPLMHNNQQLLNRIGLQHIQAAEQARQRQQFLLALPFMAPALLLVGGLLLLPVLYNIWLSVTHWQLFAGKDDFAGWQNYIQLWSNPYFDDALANTAIWVAASVVFPLLLGLALAMLFRQMPGQEWFKSLIFLPRILAPTALGVMWYYVYAPEGMLNQLLGMLSGTAVQIAWLFEDSLITPAIILAFVWQSCGLVMVLLLLGLAALPRDPLEAARLDGAHPWQVFYHITLPLLSPTILMVVILSVLAGFTVFDLLWVMGSSYPQQRTLSLAVFMYFEAFQKNSWSFAAATAMVIGGVVFAVSCLQTMLQARVDRMVR